MARKILVENNVKKVFKKNNIYSIIISILFVISIVGLCILGYSYYNYSQTIGKKIHEYIEQKENAESDLNYITNGNSIYYLKKKLDFFDEKIVFVLKEYGDVYYTYDCVQKITAGSKYEFWAYNESAAIFKGYKKGSC